MTQTIRKSNGKKSVDIYADYASGKTEFKYSVEWQKISIQEYLDLFIGEEISDEILSEVKKFKDGFAWECSKENGAQTELFSTEREARDYAFSQDC